MFHCDSRDTCFISTEAQTKSGKTGEAARGARAAVAAQWRGGRRVSEADRRVSWRVSKPDNVRASSRSNVRGSQSKCWRSKSQRFDWSTNGDKITSSNFIPAARRNGSQSDHWDSESQGSDWPEQSENIPEGYFAPQPFNAGLSFHRSLTIPSQQVYCSQGSSEVAVNEKFLSPGSAVRHARDCLWQE